MATVVTFIKLPPSGAVFEADGFMSANIEVLIWKEDSEFEPDHKLKNALERKLGAKVEIINTAIID